MILSNCPITKSDAKVLKECVMSTSDPLYRTYREFHTGVDLETKDVYSMYDGTVVYVGQNDKKQYSVIIQTGSSLCICYRWLNSISVRAGLSISAQQYIGEVKKYVHVESYNNIQSNWAVRIGKQDWYKFNIMSVFDGTYVQSVDPGQLATNLESNEDDISDYDSAMLDVITEDFIKEHSNNT